MELHELIGKRLSEEKEVAGLVTRFRGRPAVFTPEAPTDQDEGWGGLPHYPRITFGLDLSVNEERKCQGNMVLTVSAENNGTFDFGNAVSQIKKCLCSALLTPEGESAYCLAWNRSGGFSIEETNIRSQEMQLDILEFPCQLSMEPDPVDSLNAWLKGIFPESRVLWMDRPEQEEAITAGLPVFYVRLEEEKENQAQSTFAVTWMTCTLAVQVLCESAENRSRYTRAIAKYLSGEGEFAMLDGSPFFVKEISAVPGAGYLQAGQLRITGQYGILRHTERKKAIREIQSDYQ